MMIILQKTLDSLVTFSLIMFGKWKSDLNKQFNTATWFKSEMVTESGKMRRGLKCSICSKYRIRIESFRNFSDTRISAESLLTSNN